MMARSRTEGMCVTAEYRKPLPLIDDDSRPYWEGAKRHELMLKRCTRCGRHFHLEYQCWDCPEDSTLEWVKASGQGTVYTFNVFHQAYHPGFKDDLPYNTAVIELAEGPLLISNIVGCPNEEIRIGMPVEAVFDDVTPEVTLPRFRPLAHEPSPLGEGK